MIAIFITAKRRPDGSIRAGWVVYDTAGRRRGFVPAASYTPGPGALESAWPGITLLQHPSMVHAKTFDRLVKEIER